MYFRDVNYKKFAFSKFYAADSEPKLKNLQKIDISWYASDESFYKNILDQVSSSDKNKFYQAVTMQNHIPYADFYADNQFKDADTSQRLPESERQTIEYYTKGLNYTDQATIDFLKQLNGSINPSPLSSTVITCRVSTPPRIQIRIMCSGFMKPTISFGRIMLRNPREPRLMTLPARTRHRTISPPSLLRILMRKSARIWRSLPKCTSHSGAFRSFVGGR